MNTCDILFPGDELFEMLGLCEEQLCSEWQNLVVLFLLNSELPFTNILAKLLHPHHILKVFDEFFWKVFSV